MIWPNSPPGYKSARCTRSQSRDPPPSQLRSVRLACVCLFCVALRSRVSLALSLTTASPIGSLSKVSTRRAGRFRFAYDRSQPTFASARLAIRFLRCCHLVRFLRAPVRLCFLRAPTDFGSRSKVSTGGLANLFMPAIQNSLANARSYPQSVRTVVRTFVADRCIKGCSKQELHTVRYPTEFIFQFYITTYSRYAQSPPQR